MPKTGRRGSQKTQTQYPEGSTRAGAAHQETDADAHANDQHQSKPGLGSLQRRLAPSHTHHKRSLKRINQSGAPHCTRDRTRDECEQN